MKKLIALTLAVLLLIGVCACAPGEGGTGSEDVAKDLAQGQILAGYSKKDITPLENIPLGGYGNAAVRISEGFTDRLYATCVYLADKEGNSLVIVGLDVGNAGGRMQNVRETLAGVIGLPLENVILAASHTHACPDNFEQDPATTRWRNQLLQALIEGVEEAKADLAPADMLINSAETKRLNFVRRYKMSDGSVLGYESDINDAKKAGLTVVGHETEADGEVQLLKFDRGEGKTDILLTNFQVHPHLSTGSTKLQITSDVVGAYRKTVEEKLGYDVAYITGAAGNLNSYSYVDDEQLTKDHREYGDRLANYVFNVDDKYEKVNADKIQMIKLNYDAKVDHSQDHLVELAKEVVNYFNLTNTVAAVREKYLSQGFDSPYQAKAIVNRSTKGETFPFDIEAIRIGDVGFTVAPYEMFDTTGMNIKSGSPFKMTVLIGYATGAYGYMPTKEAFEHGGYETHNCYYVPGTAEELEELYLGMLNELYNGR